MHANYIEYSIHVMTQLIVTLGFSEQFRLVLNPLVIALLRAPVVIRNEQCAK